MLTKSAGAGSFEPQLHEHNTILQENNTTGGIGTELETRSEDDAGQAGLHANAWLSRDSSGVGITQINNLWIL